MRFVKNLTSKVIRNNDEMQSKIVSKDEYNQVLKLWIKHEHDLL